MKPSYLTERYDTSELIAEIDILVEKLGCETSMCQKAGIEKQLREKLKELEEYA